MKLIIIDLIWHHIEILQLNAVVDRKGVKEKQLCTHMKLREKHVT